MLRKAKDLNGYKLSARDGEIGQVQDFYFDDQSWTIRYLIADTNGWRPGGEVLISPYALGPANEPGNSIPVDLTRHQIEQSPSPDTDRPVSRQFESEYFSYYGWPVYWGGPETWGHYSHPVLSVQPPPEVGLPEDADPHLRSTEDVTGHYIQALDGEIGHVEDFVVDDETWAIRYLIVDTTNWWPGQKVLVSTRSIDKISWEESKVFINLTREVIKNGPEYTDTTLITRDYEATLHRGHGREGYWTGDPDFKPDTKDRS